MNSIVVKYLAFILSIAPLFAFGGESSSGHPFAAPKAFTLIFHDVQTPEEALTKYAKDISWAEFVLARSLSQGSLVTYRKVILPLTKKLFTPEPERNLLTLCAKLANIEASPFKPSTYISVYKEVMDGIRTDLIRVVETSSCETEDIQERYSEIYWGEPIF